jgi:hypothetical protein
MATERHSVTRRKLSNERQTSLLDSDWPSHGRRSTHCLDRGYSNGNVERIPLAVHRRGAPLPWTLTTACIIMWWLTETTGANRFQGVVRWSILFQSRVAFCWHSSCWRVVGLSLRSMWLAIKPPIITSRSAGMRATELHTTGSTEAQSRVAITA